MDRKSARELIEAFRAKHPEISEYWCIHERVHLGTLSSQRPQMTNLPKRAVTPTGFVWAQKSHEEIMDDMRFARAAVVEEAQREPLGEPFNGIFEAVHRRMPPRNGYMQWESTLFDKRQTPWQIVVGPMPMEDFDELDRLCARRWPVAMWAKFSPDQFAAEIKNVYEQWKGIKC